MYNKLNEIVLNIQYTMAYNYTIIYRDTDIDNMRYFTENLNRDRRYEIVLREFQKNRYSHAI